MNATLCAAHGKPPKTCSKCNKAANKAQAKADKAANKAKAKRAKKSAKFAARNAKSKIGQSKAAAKEMKTPWHEDGTSRSGNRDAQGRNRNGIRYDSRGKRIWKDD